MPTLDPHCVSARGAVRLPIVEDCAETSRRDQHESDTRHRSDFIRAPGAMLVLDARAVVIEVSDRCLELLGYSRQEIVGNPVSGIQERTDPGWTLAEWNGFIAQGEVRDVEQRFCRRDGTVLDLLLSATVERSPKAGEIHVIAALVDVTGRKKAEAALGASEEALRHAQKMEVLGQLTGSIAHDFNNVLQAVTGNLELLRGHIGNGRPDLIRLAGKALSAAEKAAGLTTQLLTFARSQKLDLKPLDPVEIIGQLHGFLAQAAGERISLRIGHLDTNIGACLADLNQLECALLNLVINARDAIGDAVGVITISLHAERVETVLDGWLGKGDYVRIAVRDNGPGMSEEVRRRAFEPFFTTKGVGKGTGLGLAQIDGFARNSGGMALIESTPGQGTEVAILLPRTDPPARQTSPSAISSAVTESGHGETVLIVEDDTLVRTTLAETLGDLGYQIAEAADADVALALLAAGMKVDVILTDFSMPGSMDGLEFAEAVQGRYPGLPVILTTGYADLLRGKQLPHGVGYLKKPYTVSEIAVIARTALAKSEPRVPNSDPSS